MKETNRRVAENKAPADQRSPREPLYAATRLQRWRHLAHVDALAFRRDIDRSIDPSL